MNKRINIANVKNIISALIKTCISMFYNQTLMKILEKNYER
jgi:hypothetical protein